MVVPAGWDVRCRPRGAGALCGRLARDDEAAAGDGGDDEPAAAEVPEAVGEAPKPQAGFKRSTLTVQDLPAREITKVLADLSRTRKGPS